MSALLMIPGPVEVSDAVAEAFAVPPPSHLAPDFIEAHGRALERMREVWLADTSAQPFIVPGSGTIAMEMAATNLVAPSERALVVNTGYFGDRMAEMLRRRGAEVVEVGGEVGETPSREAVAAALDAQEFKALFATHVDTSTGVRTDAEMLASLASERGVLSVFDGVCATAAELFRMAAWQADVYLTASQKALGLPAGLGLLVVSERAMKAQAALAAPPPMSLDFEAWLPIMRAYEARQPSYFSTPATNLVVALDAGLAEIHGERHGDSEGIEARFALHRRAAEAMRAAWKALGLSLLCKPSLSANTLSALRYPAGVDASLVGRIKAHGVVVAGGLHPKVKAEYFRVGHMGEVVRRPELLLRTVEAVGRGLNDAGYRADVAGARAAAEKRLQEA